MKLLKKIKNFRFKERRKLGKYRDYEEAFNKYEDEIEEVQQSVAEFNKVLTLNGDQIWGKLKLSTDDEKEKKGDPHGLSNTCVSDNSG